MEKKRNRFTDKVYTIMAAASAGAFNIRTSAGGLELIVSFLLGLTLSRTTVFNSSAPFGVSAVALFSGRTSLFTASFGAILGWISVSHKVNLFKCILALTFFVTSVLILKRTIHVESRSFSSLLAGLCYLTAEIAAIVSGNGIGLARILSEVLLVSSATSVFKTALFYKEKQFGAIALYTMILIALSSIDGINILGVGISPGRIISVCFILSAAQNCEMYTAAAVGMLSGIIFDITGPDVAAFTAAFGCGGLLCGMLKFRSKVMNSVTFMMIAPSMVLLIGGHESFLSVLLESFAASLICIITGNGVYAKVGSLFGDGTSINKEKRVKNYLKSRLSGIAVAYDQLSEELKNDMSPHNSASDRQKMYEKAFELVCSSCPMLENCQQTTEISARLSGSFGEKILRKGFSVKEDFDGFCHRPEIFAAYVNWGINELRNEMCRKNEIDESRRLLSSQYEQISKVLDTSAEKLDMELRFCDEYERAVAVYLSNLGVKGEVLAYYDGIDLLRIEICAQNGNYRLEANALCSDISKITGHDMGLPEIVCSKNTTCISLRELSKYECSVGAAAEKRSSDGCSGDRGTYFYGEDGKLYIILCDGMGSGDGAAALAVKMIKYMQCFLKAGADADGAADIINTAMLLKNDGTAFSTADIAVIDPASGDLSMVKCGAEESYLRKGNGVIRLGRSTVGRFDNLQDLLRPHVSKAKLEEGDMLVMGSDGVFCGSGSKIEDYLMKIHSDDPKELASILLKMTRLDISNDDRTIIAVSYRKRK